MCMIYVRRIIHKYSYTMKPYVVINTEALCQVQGNTIFIAFELSLEGYKNCVQWCL
jgi:hypothetical protein